MIEKQRSFRQNNLIIIQGRMGSKRFPGKTLYPLSGKPSLVHLLESLFQGFPREQIVIATSRLEQDDPIEQIARSVNLKFHRGDPENVALRFFEIIEKYEPAYFTRVSGDSPLMDYRIIHQVISGFEEINPDIATTALTRTFPSGMNVEVVSSHIFLQEYLHFINSEHFEHVTKYFYEHSSLFNIKSIDCDIPGASKCKFSFDTSEDLRRLESLFASFNKPHWEYSLEEKCSLYRRLFPLNKC